MRYLFSSESVTEGHPDKFCDLVSDSILDVILEQDPYARVALETVAKGSVKILGEVTANAQYDPTTIARNVVRGIGYTTESFGIDPNELRVDAEIVQQSPDISQGVDGDGAGDQGMMFGYACNETPALMPAPIYLAHRLANQLTLVRKDRTLPYLRPDGKTQITIDYTDPENHKVTAVVVAAQHDPDVEIEQLRKDVKRHVIEPILAYHGFYHGDAQLFINNTNRFVKGGPMADAGLTGRKIIVDTYGGSCGHGGGAFCIAGHARVNTDIGTKKIQDCKSSLGSLVKTDVHPMPAGEWWDNGTKETLIIQTEDGFSLEATPDHKIRILDEDGNYTWKEISKVLPTDFVPIQRKNRLFGNGEIGKFAYKYKEGTQEKRKKKYAFPEKLTDDYAFLLGLLVGDGDCTDEGCIKICACEKEMKQNVQNLFIKIFGDKGKIYGHWAYIGGVELRAYLEFLGLRKLRSFEKEVPEAIWNGTKSNAASFLRGLFDTDGCVRIGGRNKTSPRIHLASTSKHLAEEIQLLLLNFGIVSRIYKVEPGRVSFINGRKITTQHILYNLTIKGAESVQIFKNEIGFGLQRKNKILNKIDLSLKTDRLTIPNQRRRIIGLFKRLPLSEQEKDSIKISRFTRKSGGKATKELTYEKLEQFLLAYENFLKGDPEFEYLKKLFFMKHYYTSLIKTLPSFCRTFDLNIPTTHTFTANGFIVHNSGKDPTKVDRTASYMLRHIAKNIVAAGLADRCEIQLGFAIGGKEPVSLHINAYDTEKVPVDTIYSAVEELFPLSPGGMIQYLDLRRPIFSKTTNYGHFGREGLPWESTHRVDDLRAFAKL